MLYRRREAKLAAKLDKLLAGERIEMPAGLLEEKVWQVLRALEASEQKSKAERESVLRLMSDISHQLKTPLSSLQLHLELAGDPTLTETQRTAFLAECKTQSAKIGWLTESLLKIARLESGLIAVRKCPTDLAETVRAAVDSVRARIAVKGLTITERIPESLPCSHDAVWTGEALCNILDNAVKYTPQGGITVCLEQGPIFTRIDITDTGIGLASEAYTKIFTRFYRVRSEAGERVEGTGLGLTIAREILRRQDGNITVSSELGKGSTFSVFLQK